MVLIMSSSIRSPASGRQSPFVSAEGCHARFLQPWHHLSRETAPKIITVVVGEVRKTLEQLLLGAAATY
eukprot:scaffold159_cov151-Skeletonema_menzelii.AAC.15